MAGLEPARANYSPTDFKSVASTIPPHRLFSITRVELGSTEFAFFIDVLLCASRECVLVEHDLAFAYSRGRDEPRARPTKREKPPAQRCARRLMGNLSWRVCR